MKFKAITTILLLASLHAQAEIYKWTDANGRVHYSDRKPATTAAETFKVNTFTQTGVKLERSSNAYAASPESSSKAVSDEKVVMYSTSWCGYCKKARAYFKKNNIAFVEYDIEKDARAKSQYDKLNGKGVPVILVGEKRMNGFNESGFERIYQNKS